MLTIVQAAPCPAVPRVFIVEAPEVAPLVLHPSSTIDFAGLAIGSSHLTGKHTLGGTAVTKEGVWVTRGFAAWGPWATTM